MLAAFSRCIARLIFCFILIYIFATSYKTYNASHLIYKAEVSRE
jgi:hypothetical protein